MSKVIGIIAEDLSDIDSITNFLGKYVSRNKFSIKKFVGNGCGKLRNKCGSWTAALFEAGCHHVLIFHDLDRNNEASLKKLILNKIPKNLLPDSLIVIPIEEIEAWLLSDEAAIGDVFGMKNPPPRIVNCETVSSPKEHLRDIAWTLARKRYLNTTHNNKISEKISIKNLRRCPSYKPFDEYVMTSIFKLAPANQP